MRALARRALLFAACCCFLSHAHALRVAAVQRLSLDAATPADTLAANAAAMAASVKAASAAAVDLVVFPEFTLFGATMQLSTECAADASRLDAFCEALPAVGTRIPCPSSPSSTDIAALSPLAVLACASSASATLIVVSYNTCELDGVQRFNTQVVVQNGTLVQTYRKRHPFFTSCFATPPLELRSFRVRDTVVGLFTCFDLLFADPKENLYDAGVRVFSYSSAIPLVGRAAVEAWSWAKGVAVVSSNAALAESAVIVNGTAVARCDSKVDCVAIADI
jgi:predicted amidohydrolase